MRAARRAVHNRGAIAMFAFGTKRTFVFQLEPISDVDQTHTTFVSGPGEMHRSDRCM